MSTLAGRLNEAIERCKPGRERQLARCVALVLMIDDVPDCSPQDNVWLAPTTRRQLRAVMGLEPPIRLRLDPSDGAHVDERADNPVLATWRCYCSGEEDYYDMGADEPTCRNCGAPEPPEKR